MKKGSQYFGVYRMGRAEEGGRRRRRRGRERGAERERDRQHGEQSLTTTYKRDRYGGFNVSTNGRIDRTTEAPFLLRCFVFHNETPKPEQFVARLPRDVHVYTWRDATLREVAELLREVDKEAARPGAVLDFYLVFRTVGKEKEMTVKHIGAGSKWRECVACFCHLTLLAEVADADGRSSAAILKQTKRLFNDSQFEIGDYLVANVLP
jgi:hypothetical protein